MRGGPGPQLAPHLPRTGRRARRRADGLARAIRAVGGRSDAALLSGSRTNEARRCGCGRPGGLRPADPAFGGAPAPRASLGLGRRQPRARGRVFALGRRRPRGDPHVVERPRGQPQHAGELPQGSRKVSPLVPRREGDRALEHPRRRRRAVSPLARGPRAPRGRRLPEKVARGAVALDRPEERQTDLSGLAALQRPLVVLEPPQRRRDRTAALQLSEAHGLPDLQPLRPGELQGAASQGRRGAAGLRRPLAHARPMGGGGGADSAPPRRAPARAHEAHPDDGKEPRHARFGDARRPHGLDRAEARRPLGAPRD